MRNKTLMLGASSFLGKHIYQLDRTNHLVGTFNKKPQPGLIHFDSLSDNLEEKFPLDEFSHCIILLGIIDLDECAKDKKRSRLTNIESIKKIIDTLKKHSVIPVYTSTDLVFDGEKGGYKETDVVNPLITYSQQKVEIEEYLKSLDDKHLIVRLSKIIGNDTRSKGLFMYWIQEILKSNPIYVTTDQIATPIDAIDVAKTILELISLKKTGLYHIGGPKAYSRYELVQLVIQEMKKYQEIEPKVIPCRINDLGLLEKRPLDVSLNSENVARFVSIKPKDPKELVVSQIKEMFI